MRNIVVIAHNIRSTHNVGSILRTAEGFGIERVYLTGYTPYPCLKVDNRLPHLAGKIEAQINKTALGAQKLVDASHHQTVEPVLQKLKNDGYELVALELAPMAVDLGDFRPGKKVALLLGSEIGGVDPKLLARTDAVIKIPMLGEKGSFNVAVAAAIALYHLRYHKA